MCRLSHLLLSLVAVAILAAPLSAQDVDDPAHDELREFRQRLVTAILADDIDTQMQMSHPDVVTMWQDGRVASGHDGLQAFLDELGKGADRGFLGYTQEPTPLALADIYDDRFAFAHGTSVAQYDLYGMAFDLPNYWTAALLKEDGQWKLIGYHVSGNIADNPFLDAAKRSLYLVGGVTGLLGLLVGLLIGRRMNRVNPRAAQN